MPRPVGSKNKVPARAKENIQAVFVRLGGTSAMARWAEANQNEFYKIYARLIPNEVTGPDGVALFPARVEVSLVKPG